MSDHEDSAIILLTVNNGNNCNDESDTQIEQSSQNQAETNHGPHVSSKKPSSMFLFISAGMAALGGLLFGYDIGIIATALPQITKEFSLLCYQQEMVVSLMLVGALFASLVGGSVIDQIGSRISILINAVVFVIGALVLALSSNYAMLLVGRFVVGFAVALSAVSECIYISEIATPKNRGMLISLNEVAITAGFLVAYLVGMICNSYSNGWRFMFGFGAVPALCQLFGMIKLPNSPHYLILKHRDQEAEDAVKQLRQLSSPNEIRQELTHIRLSMEAGRSQSCLSLCSSADGLRSAMLIAFGLVMSQQFTGQSNVLSYATTIFQQVGFCGDDALPTVGLGIVKLAATVVSLLVIDRLGRRKTLLLGASVMAVSLILLGSFAILQQKTSPMQPACNDASSTAHQQTNVTCSSGELSASLRYTALGALMSYVASYSFSFGPVTWLLLSEIFPSTIKGRAMAISTSVNWAANLAISATFLKTVQLLSLGGVFLGYALLTILSTLFIFSVVPETKNKTLHRITKELNSTTFRDRMTRNFSQIFSTRLVIRPNGIYSQLSSEMTGNSRSTQQALIETET